MFLNGSAMSEKKKKKKTQTLCENLRGLRRVHDKKKKKLHCTKSTVSIKIVRREPLQRYENINGNIKPNGQ